MHVTARDVLEALEPSRKLALWAYAKRVHGKQNYFHFSFNGPSEELYRDLTILSGAKQAQIAAMKANDENEEIQELISKQEKTILKVIKFKLKQIYIKDRKERPGKQIREVHAHILKRNLTLL